MAIYVRYMPLNQLYLKTPWNNPTTPWGLELTGWELVYIIVRYFVLFSYSDIIISENIRHKVSFPMFNGMVECI
jgi:hypothetical protein